MVGLWWGGLEHLLCWVDQQSRLSLGAQQAGEAKLGCVTS